MVSINKRAGDTEEGKRCLLKVLCGSHLQDQSLAECKWGHWGQFGESSSTDSTRTHSPDCVLKGSLKMRISQTPFVEQRLHPSSSLQFRALESTRFFWPFFSTDKSPCRLLECSTHLQSSRERLKKNIYIRNTEQIHDGQQWWNSDIAPPVWNGWRMWKRCLGQFYEHVWLCENWESGQISTDEVTYLECRMRSG